MVEAESLSKASELLCVAQPAIGLQIKHQPVTEELLSEEAVMRAVQAMRDMKPGPKPNQRLAELKRLVAEGVLSREEAAPAMDRLRPAETPEPYPFGAADAYREVVKTLRESLEAEDIAAAGLCCET